MTFTQLTNEAFGAMNRGYRMDLTCKRVFDEAVLAQLERDMGETFVNNLIDSFEEFESDLYQGDDGEYYAVAFDLKHRPVVWRRLTHD